MKFLSRALPCLLGAFALWGAEAKGQEVLEPPVTFEAAFTVDAFSNVRGGISTGTRWLSNFDVVLSMDMEGLLGWSGATVFLYGLGNQGRSPGDLVGDAQGVSNIDAPASWKLYEAWIEQNLFGDLLSFKAGLYDLNSEFDAIDAGGLFINSSHGIGPDFSQTGLNGPSIFPVTSLGFRARIALSENFSVQGVVLDAVPGDPENPTGTQVSLSREEGALIAGEVGFTFGAFSRWLPSNGRIAFGSYIYTRDFECVLPSGMPGGHGSQARATGFYLIAEGDVYSEPGNDGQGARVFSRVGISDKHVNQFSTYWGGGVKYTGVFPSRDEDKFGLAFAAARNGDPFRQLQAKEGAPVDWTEVAFEMTYLVELPSGFAIQPDIQYIVNPGTDRNLENALVFALRTGVSF